MGNIYNMCKKAEKIHSSIGNIFDLCTRLKSVLSLDLHTTGWQSNVYKYTCLNLLFYKRN